MSLREVDVFFPTEEDIQVCAYEIWKKTGNEDCDANWYLAQKCLESWICVEVVPKKHVT